MTPRDIAQGGFVKRAWARGGQLVVDALTDLRANTWKVFYSDGDRNVKELALAVAGTYLRSAGTTVAPTFSTLLDTDIRGGNWKIFYTNGSGVLTELALGSNSGDVLTTNGASSAPSFTTPAPGTTTLRSYASSNEDVTNSNTLTASTQLTLTLAGSKTYYIEGFLVLQGTGGGGVKADLGGGAATMNSIALQGYVVNGSGTLTAIASGPGVTSLTTLLDDETGAGTRSSNVIFSGTVEVNAGGTLAVRYAEHTATAANTGSIKRGSWLMATLLS